MKTKAAILVQQKEELVIDEINIPKLLHGQVLVEIRSTRICGSQIGEIDGVKGPDKWLPHLLGHEAGGIVLEAGTGVKTVKTGDHVVAHWREGSGIDAERPVYTWGDKKVNAGAITTFSELAIISENRLTKVAPSTDPEVSALLADTLTTGFGIINNDAKVKIGESVVVIGAGGIGLGAILGASLVHAYPIIAVDLHDHKLDVARQFGATHTINATTEDFAHLSKEITGGKPDVVIDGTGNPSVIEKAYELSNDHGRTILFGVMHHNERVKIHTLPLHFDKILKGSVGGSSLPDIDIPRYLRLIENNRFSPQGMISHRFTLDDINLGIQKMRSGEMIHAVVNFE